MSVNRLDNEFSAFLRAQRAWHESPEATGRLTVLSNVPLRDKLDPSKLQNRLDRFAEMSFDGMHLEYLATQPQIEAGFVDYLKAQEQPHPMVRTRGDQVMVRVDGKLADLPLWEVPISNQMHLLYHEGIRVENNINVDFLLVEGTRRFQHKADLMRNSTFAFAEAGTRWRYDPDWYDLLMNVMLGDVPNILVGTTNPNAAMTFALALVDHSTDEYLRVEHPSVRSLEATVKKKQTRPIVVSEVTGFELAHLHSHFGTDLIYEWGLDLTNDMGPGGNPLPLRFETTL